MLWRNDRLPLVLMGFLLAGVIFGAPPPGAAQGSDVPDDWSGSSKDDPGTFETLPPERYSHPNPTKEDQVPKPFTGDPQYLDLPDLYIGSGPAGTNYPLWNPIPNASCSGYATNVIPVGIAQVGGGHYLSYGGIPGTRIIPVGVSPDSGCHLYLGDPTTDVHKCEQEINWQAAIDNLGQAGLNKLHLWVSLGSANDSRNTPFLLGMNSSNCAQTSSCCPATMSPCFRLDQENLTFFNTLRLVVNEARKQFMYVEITFFAPFEKDVPASTFANGPWGGQGAWAPDPAQQNTIVGIKFSGPNNAVLDAQSGDNLTMQTQFQYNVIKWTIDELWCFDNVWYEIANEPESGALNPTRVDNWEKSMVTNVVNLDTTTRHQYLMRPHLIGVQVFTQSGAAEFTGPNNPNVSIVNGHYSEVVNGNDDNGAIVVLARADAGAAKVIGFNETKITGIGTSGVGNGFSRRLLNGSTVPSYGVPEPARAEAFEFMLTRGSAMDRYGYLGAGNPGSVGQTASDMASLKAFILSLPIGQLTVPSTNPPSWLPTLNPHPTEVQGTVGWNSARKSRRYWGAIQTPDGTASPNRFFALYLHNSAPRCYESGSPPVTVNYDPSIDPPYGCPQANYLAFKTYDARVWTTVGSQYSDTLTLQLGAAPGNFRLCWIDPATHSVVSQQLFAWNGSPSGMPVTSPAYSYDIILKLNENPSAVCP